MQATDQVRWFFGWLILVLGIIGIILLFRFIFSSGSSTDKTQNANAIVLSDYQLTDSYVELTQKGGVNANQNYYSATIRISAEEARILVKQSYNNNIINQKGYPNNAAAYEAFLAALKSAAFTQERKQSLITKPLEACPSETHYYYKLVSNSTTIMDRWYTACGKNRYGNFGGSNSLSLQYFIQQIPDYTNITGSINL